MNINVVTNYDREWQFQPVPNDEATQIAGLLTDHPPVSPQAMARVLTEIAEIASETLELQEVFDRVATAVRQLIPFDNMSVVRIIDGERAVLHATTVPCMTSSEMSYEPKSLASWSPRWRPCPGPKYKIDDANRELDPSYPMDAMVLEQGLGSGLWEPFQLGNSFVGGVWLCSRFTHAFSDMHQYVLRPIAALLGTMVEHWRIWDTERRRRARLDQIEELLGTLAESLDVREVFQRLSLEMQPILMHDLMVLTELDIRARTIKFTALAGTCEIPLPTTGIPLTEAELEQRDGFEIVHDIAAELAPDTELRRFILSSCYRSWLRVPVFLSGEIKGGLSFFHRDIFRYGREDAEVARRLADRIALTLSLQRLAEEALIVSEAQEREERLKERVVTLTRELESRDQKRVVGISAFWKETLVAVERVASSETTVLITGESGTGKDVIANLIHQGSSRAEKPFVAINCATLPEQLLESELFGYEKGAFTGATATKIGRIEQAAGGTLFLDEITEMSTSMQAKFLRVLEEREFQRVGGTRTLKADIRVAAATNRDLMAAIARQTFREDLYYRLNVFRIHIPPLRERREDILPLAETLLEDLGKMMGRPVSGISRDAREALLNYPWPGNVRELRNAIERAILLCDGGLITSKHLPVFPVKSETVRSEDASPAPDLAAPIPSGTVNLATMERSLIENALSQTKGNKSKAARLLGLSRAQLYARLTKYSL